MALKYISKGTVIESIDGVWYAPAVIKSYKNIPEFPGSYCNEIETKEEGFARELLQETGIKLQPGYCREISADSQTTYFLGLKGVRMRAQDLTPPGKKYFFSGSQGEYVEVKLYEVSELLESILEKEKKVFVDMMLKKAQLDGIFAQYVSNLAKKDPRFHRDNLERVDVLLAKK